jgi:PII-like signaling protein
MNRSIDDIRKLHHARQKLCASATTLRTIVHFNLDEARLRLLVLVHRVPLGFECIDDEVTCFIRTPKGDVQCRTIFIHNATRDILLLASQIVVTGSVVAARHPATGKRANLHRRFTIYTPAFDACGCQSLGIFFLILSKIASVSLIFFCGLAFTTLRKR